MANRRKRKRTASESEVDLTPMIDVVFQLLIFFVVTFQTPPLLGRLDVFRPAPDPSAPPPKQIDDMIRITVHSRGRFMFNQRWMTLPVIKSNLARMAAVSKTQTVLIQCAEPSLHLNLVQILNVCSKLKMTNLSVVTLPPAR